MLIFFAEAAPLAGRLAFAAVFLLLIIWLLFMPKRLLGDHSKAVRVCAVIIAIFQLLIYLFWK